MNKIIIIVYLFFTSANIFAQSEQLIFQSDRSVYLSGETILHSSTLSSPMIKLNIPWSKSVYVQLLNFQGVAIAKQILELNDHNASGALLIPESCPSGYYLLHSETKWMQNEEPDKKSMKVIMIIQKNQAVSFTTLPKTKDKASISTLNELNFSCIKKHHSQRDTVSIDLKNNFPSNLSSPLSYTIAVIPKGSNKSLSRMKNYTFKNVKGQQILPESQGMLLSGNVSGKHQSSAEISISFFDSKLSTYSEYTKQDGSFIFHLPYAEGSSDAFIYCSDTTRELHLMPQFRKINPKLPSTLLFNDIDIDLIDRLNTNDIIKKGSQPLRKNVQTPIDESFFEPSKIINIIDYIELPSLTEYITELIPTAYIRSKDDKKELRFSYPPYSNPIYPPLILLDKLKIMSIDDLWDINTTEIKSIDIVDQNYILGNRTYSGIFSVNTKNGDFAQQKLPKNGKFLNVALYSKRRSEYSITTDELEERRNPLFRNCLFWKSGITYKELKKLNFYTGDEAGEFEIIINGLSPEGDLYEGRSTFIIQ